MAGSLLAKAVGWLRKLFRGEKAENPVSSIYRENEASIPPAIPEFYLQGHRFLLQDGHPVGRQRSRRHSGIRCLPVKNFAEAYCFFIRLCDQRRIILRQAGGYLHYELLSKKKTVIFDLTDRIIGKPPGTIAVLKVNAAIVGIEVTEIEFVELKKKTGK